MENISAKTVLVEINKLLEKAEDYKKKGFGNKRFFIYDVCGELSIFDWWNDYLSTSQLKKMKDFLEKSIQLGFEGYVCFKVGAAGCAHGMWAHKELSTTGYSPDGDCLFHSFRNGDNYWDGKLNGEWLSDKCKTEENRYPEFTFKQIKEEVSKMKGGEK